MPLSSTNDYEIAFEVRPDYLYARVTLTRNEYNIARQYWTDMLRMIHKRRSPRAVIDISTPVALRPIEAQALMSEFSKFLYPGVKVAIVNRHVVAEVRQAVQSAASIQGRVITIVDNVAAAEDWLKEPTHTFAPAILDSNVQDLTNTDSVQ